MRFGVCGFGIREPHFVPLELERVLQLAKIVEARRLALRSAVAGQRRRWPRKGSDRCASMASWESCIAAPAAAATEPMKARPARAKPRRFAALAAQIGRCPRFEIGDLIVDRFSGANAPSGR